MTRFTQEEIEQWLPVSSRLSDGYKINTIDNTSQTGQRFP